MGLRVFSIEPFLNGKNAVSRGGLQEQIQSEEL